MTYQTTIDYTRVAELHTKGWTAPAIAAEVHCDERSITRWRTRNGLGKPSAPHAGNRLTDERRQAIEAMLDDGASYNEISNTLHVHRLTLKRHFPGRAFTRAQSAQAAVMGRRFHQIPARLP